MYTDKRLRSLVRERQRLWQMLRNGSAQIFVEVGGQRIELRLLTGYEKKLVLEQYSSALHFYINSLVMEKQPNEQPFEQWLIELHNVTTEHTGLGAYEIHINEAEARKWYDDGFTPYQCFRETWGMENDIQ